MRHAIIFAIVAVAVGHCVDAVGFGAPNDNVDAQSRSITPKIIDKAKELGKTDKVELVKLSENTSTRYNLYVATLRVDGKSCTITVSEENPPKWLEQPDKNNCILCC